MKKTRQELLRDLIEKIGYAMKEMHASYNFPFGNITLGRPQIMILFYIAEQKVGATVKDLAKLMHVTPGAVTQFIDIMVGKKLVKREGNLSDRRLTNIKLTTDTQKQFKSFKEEYFLMVSRIFDDFSLEELSQFGQLVAKVKSLPHGSVKK